MKFTCEKALLVSALSVASRTVAQKSTIPCLEGVLLRAGVALQLTGYNLETGITVHVGAQIQEAGSCVMPARLFFDIVRKLPDEMVSITVDHKQQVSIRAGAAFFQITAMDSEDYPELPDVNGKSGVTMPQSALKAMISGTIFSVSENQARPIQTGCLMEVTEDSVTMVAVDSFRLARRTWHTETPRTIPSNSSSPPPVSRRSSAFSRTPTSPLPSRSAISTSSSPSATPCSSAACSRANSSTGAALSPQTAAPSSPRTSPS